MTEDVKASEAGGPVERIRELTDGWRGPALLVRQGSRYYVVSSISDGLLPAETLVFESDAEGNVESHLEVAGGRGVSRDEAIAELEDRDLNDD